MKKRQHEVLAATRKGKKSGAKGKIVTAGGQHPETPEQRRERLRKLTDPVENAKAAKKHFDREALREGHRPWL
jgi:hypothetical protein